MGDDANVAETGQPTPVVETFPQRIARRKREKAEAKANSDASPQSDPVDESQYEAQAYVIRARYSARRIKNRTWVGKPVSRALFVEAGDWIVTREHDGHKFVMTNFEFNASFVSEA